MKLKLFTFIVCYAGMLSAQVQSVSFSDGQQTKNRFLFPYMIQGTADSLFVFAFDENLVTSLWSLEAEQMQWQTQYRTIPTSSNSLSPFRHQGKWWAQRAFWSENGVDSLFKVDLVELDSRLLPSKEPIVIFDELPKGPLPVRIEKRVSPNGKYRAFFAIQDYVHPKAPGMHWLIDSETEIFHYSILDADSLIVRHQGKVTLPLKRVGERLSVKDFTVDNDGKVIVVADAITRKFDKAIGTPHLRPTTYFFNPSTHEISFYEWPFDRQFISNLNVGLDSENNVICVGFYSETSYEYRKGLVYIKLDAKRSKVLRKELIAFPSDFLREMHSSSKVAQGSESIAHDMYFFKISPSGQAWIIAEEQVFDGGNSYWFNDLWVLGISADGKFTNAHYFKKRTRRDGVLRSSFLGFSALVDGENLWTLYNDFRKKSLTVSRFQIGGSPLTEQIALPSKMRAMPSATKQTKDGTCTLLLLDEEFRKLKLMRLKLR